MNYLLLKKILLIFALFITIFTLFYSLIKYFFFKKKYSNLLNFVNSSDDDFATEIDLNNIKIKSLTKNKLDSDFEKNIVETENNNLLNNHIV